MFQSAPAFVGRENRELSLEAVLHTAVSIRSRLCGAGELFVSRQIEPGTHVSIRSRLCGAGERGGFRPGWRLGQVSIRSRLCGAGEL